MPAKRKLEMDSPLPVKRSRVSEVLERGNNALMQLNEIGIKGLKWTIDQINNMFPQRFRATCMFTEPFTGLFEVIPTGVYFTTEGNNKSTCRHEIAIQIMSRLSGKIALEVSVNESEMIVPVSIKTVLPKMVSNATNDFPKMEEAVKLLHDKVTNLEYNYTLTEDGYCCYTSYKGFMVKGNGTSKKIAKRSVAAQILMKYFKFTFAEDDTPQSTSIDSTTTMETDKLPFNRRKNFSNQIQALVKNGFEKLVSSLDVQYSKRKVVSGIVISRKLKDVFPDYYRQEDDALTPDIIDPLQFFTKTGWTINPDDSGEILKLVSISSGTKCISGNDINITGEVVNDCHAEVIAKRALQFFLIRTIERLVHNVHLCPTDLLYGCDILTIYDNENPWIYKLKDNVKFHLYVSSSPCGDSRIFFPQATNLDESEDENDEDSHPNRKNRGVLRTKIECGEGTIPIKMKHIQTWDGILGGERLLTMSCSDKVCVWNVIGLQGALLSNALSKPIYLDSITIGSLFQLDHSQRALFDRAKCVTNEPDWILPISKNSQHLEIDVDVEQGELSISIDNIDPFRVNTPYILTVTDQDERCPGKASNFSTNWILGETSLEIIATSKGLTIENLPSRLSKRNLLKSFLKVFEWAPFICPVHDIFFYNEMKSLINYPDNAIGAVNYQKKKIALYKFFDQQNLGRWIGKPLEQDCFGLKLSS